MENLTADILLRSKATFSFQTITTCGYNSIEKSVVHLWLGFRSCNTSCIFSLGVFLGIMAKIVKRTVATNSPVRESPDHSSIHTSQGWSPKCFVHWIVEHVAVTLQQTSLLTQEMHPAHVDCPSLFPSLGAKQRWSHSLHLQSSDYKVAGKQNVHRTTLRLSAPCYGKLSWE